jgi:hypothetical protein
MEKTLEMHLEEQRKDILESLALLFENKAANEIRSNINNYNDCALLTKAYMTAAAEIRGRK